MPKYSVIKHKNSKKVQYYGTGRRKTATARVFLELLAKDATEHNIVIKVGGRERDNYFGNSIRLSDNVVAPLKVVDLYDSVESTKFKILITVKGSGLSAQSEAIRHALTMALIAYDEDTTTIPEGLSEEELDLIKASSYRKKLRRVRFVTRNPRQVERKKYGLRKARKPRQYSKR